MPEEGSLVYQPNKILTLFVCGACLWLIWYSWMILLVWDYWDIRKGAFLELMSWVVAPYLTVAMPFYAYVYWRHWPTTFTVTSEGLHDARVTKRVVPWSDIQSLVLKRNLFKAEIIVTLKPTRTLLYYGAPYNLPSWFTGKRPSTVAFSVATGLARSSPGIANDINRYEKRPENLRVGKA